MDETTRWVIIGSASAVAVILAYYFLSSRQGGIIIPNINITGGTGSSGAGGSPPYGSITSYEQVNITPNYPVPNNHYTVFSSSYVKVTVKNLTNYALTVYATGYVSMPAINWQVNLSTQQINLLPNSSTEVVWNFGWPWLWPWQCPIPGTVHVEIRDSLGNLLKAIDWNFSYCFLT